MNILQIFLFYYVSLFALSMQKNNNEEIQSSALSMSSTISRK